MENKLYKQAGVSLKNGYETINKIKPMIEKTKNKGVLGGVGNFAALFDIKKYNFNDPVLVSSTDGVGTKLLLAIDGNRGHSQIGQDLVAMCVNDIVALGAKPIFFLDYFATGKLDPNIASKVIYGITKSLATIDTALIGGETAEMPGMYKSNHYDIAGFAVGIVERDSIINGVKNSKEGDVLIGLPSSGIHSNGFSLVRKIFFEDHNFSYVESPPYAKKTLIAELLTPTKIYVSVILELIKKVSIHGIAHITGGGFYENIPRMMNENLQFDIDFKKIKTPEIFKWMQKLSNATDKEMFSTFNMGIGMVISVNPKDEELAINVLHDLGEDAYTIGKIIKKR